MALTPIGSFGLGIFGARMKNVLKIRLNAPPRHYLRLIGGFEHRFVIADRTKRRV
jgi:hypothetical protein